MLCECGHDVYVVHFIVHCRDEEEKMYRIVGFEVVPRRYALIRNAKDTHIINDFCVHIYIFNVIFSVMV